MSEHRLARNWDVRLNELARELEGQPFRWGETDCGSLVRRALDVAWDPCPPPPLGEAPRYDDEASARAIYEETGGVGGLLEAAGAERVPLAFARSRDVLVGLDPQGGIPGAAVVVLPSFLVASERRGVELRPLKALRRADPEGVVAWRLLP